MTLRGNLINEIQGVANKVMSDAELEDLSLFKLLKAYEVVLSNFEFRMEKTVHTVVNYHYSIEERREFLLKSLNTQKKLSFRGIFEACKNKMHAIFTFLAMLELMQQELILFTEGEGVNDFTIESTSKLNKSS